MSFATIVEPRGLIGEGIAFLGRHASHRPAAALSTFMAGGLALLIAGVAAGSAVSQHRLANEAARAEMTRSQAQRELNAIAARVGELQAQANRLNALGARLTRIGELRDSEFDFDAPVGTGGAAEVRDIPGAQLGRSLAALEQQLQASGDQLTVLEAVLRDRRLAAGTTILRQPVRNGYVTSPFGERVDPLLGGTQFHKGIDFSANTGDPVLAVAPGVVSFAGERSGYGNVVEVDHGDGYVTRYAHNSRLERRVGELVHAGQEIAKAGSTGRSTGPHVHLEVWRDGHVVNPKQFLQRRG